MSDGKKKKKNPKGPNFFAYPNVNACVQGVHFSRLFERPQKSKHSIYANGPPKAPVR